MNPATMTSLEHSLKQSSGVRFLGSHRMMRQLEVDCALLEELRVMDYSLLLGIHFKSPANASSPHHAADKVTPFTLP